ncbi:MAG TPA: heavy-metal-associated domain-containing protein [Candidatus Coprenecus avistercoris]|uniref:Heavy-metal-associated domain-containing protein n=1 Tax=Candidatus Coprenecus avistercoris TaxID=2840730 RepID=A0A9D1E0L0_9BACT|nr:heavy-metal-associated domain-containing protein [Candidatus Coprenecus avistercoris]
MTKVIYNVKGMACNHCVMHVQRALESIPGVKAFVTLDPAQAEIEFFDKVYSKSELQSVISEKAGDYILEDK